MNAIPNPMHGYDQIGIEGGPEGLSLIIFSLSWPFVVAAYRCRFGLATRLFCRAARQLARPHFNGVSANLLQASGAARHSGTTALNGEPLNAIPPRRLAQLRAVLPQA